MNSRVREAVDALRVLDEHERLTALQMVTPDVRTRPQKRGLRAMWLVREKGKADPGPKTPRERNRTAPAAADRGDFGLPGGDE
jgi:hypothetical protein